LILAIDAIWAYDRASGPTCGALAVCPPGEVVTRLNAEIDKALAAPDVRGTLEDNGMTMIGGTPAEFAALMQDGIARYGTIIKAAGIEPE